MYLGCFERQAAGLVVGAAVDSMACLPAGERGRDLCICHFAHTKSFQRKVPGAPPQSSNQGRVTAGLQLYKAGEEGLALWCTG